MAKKKLKNVVNKTAKHGFISPMAQYLRYGDYDKSEVGEGEVIDRDTGSRYRDSHRTNIQNYAQASLSSGKSAFRFQGKLYSVKPSRFRGVPAIETLKT